MFFKQMEVSRQNKHQDVREETSVISSDYASHQ